METINWLDKLINLLTALIQAGIIALVANFFVRKTFTAISNNSAMSNYGINKIDVDDSLYEKQMKRIFDKAVSVKACYVTGENLFQEHFKEIYYALNRKKNPLKKLEILLCRPDTEFMKNLEEIEKIYGNRKHQDLSLTDASNLVVSQFSNVDNVEIRYNDTFYFLPYMIAEYHTKDGIIKEVYSNYNIPPRQSKNAISLVARVFIKNEFENYNYDAVDSKWVLDEEGNNVVIDLEKNFDYIWGKSNIATLENTEQKSARF